MGFVLYKDEECLVTTKEKSKVEQTGETLKGWWEILVFRVVIWPWQDSRTSPVGQQVDAGWGEQCSL